MNRIPLNRRGTAKFELISRFRSMLMSQEPPILSASDNVNYALKCREVNEQGGVVFGKDKKGASVTSKELSRSSQIPYWRLAHSLVGPSSRQAFALFKRICFQGNGSNAVYEVICTPDFAVLNGLEKVVCLEAMRKRHMTKSAKGGRLKWSASESKCFINHIKNLVVLVIRLPGYKQDFPVEKWTTGRIQFGGKMILGLAGLILELCAEESFVEDADEAGNRNVLVFNPNQTTVSHRRILADFVARIIGDTNDMSGPANSGSAVVVEEGSNEESNRQEQAVESNRQEQAVDVEGDCDGRGHGLEEGEIMEQGEGGEEGGRGEDRGVVIPKPTCPGGIASRTRGHKKKAQQCFSGSNSQLYRSPSLELVERRNVVVQASTVQEPPPTQSSDDDTPLEVLTVKVGNGGNACGSSSRQMETSRHVTNATRTNSTDSAQILQAGDSTRPGQAICPPVKVGPSSAVGSIVNLGKVGGGSRGGQDRATSVEAGRRHRKARRVESRATKRSNERVVVRRSTCPANRFARYHEMIHGKADGVAVVDDSYRNSTPVGEVQVTELPIAIDRNAMHGRVLSDSIIRDITNDIIESAAIGSGLLHDDSELEDERLVEMASESHFRVVRESLRQTGFFVDESCLVRSGAARMRSCVDAVLKLSLEKYHELGVDQSDSWWKGVIQKLDRKGLTHGKDRIMTKKEAYGEWIREQCSHGVFVDKCSLDVFIAMYVEECGLQHKETPLLTPMYGAQLIGSFPSTEPQTPHTDYVMPEAGIVSYEVGNSAKTRRWHVAPEIINLTVMFNGEQPFALRVWPRAHIDHNQNDILRRSDRIESASSILVTVPPYSLLIFRGDLHHAGCGGSEMLEAFSSYALTPADHKQVGDKVFMDRGGAQMNIRGHMYFYREGGTIYDAVWSCPMHTKTVPEGSLQEFPMRQNDDNSKHTDPTPEMKTVL